MHKIPLPSHQIGMTFLLPAFLPAALAENRTPLFWFVPAAFLVLGLFAFQRKQHAGESSGGGAATQTAQIACLGLLGMFALFWSTTPGVPFITTGRESFLIALSTHNTTNFSTFILQDVSTAPHAAGHPFFYLNHPNLPARVLSFVWSQIGLSLKSQMLLLQCLSALGLGTVFFGLRRITGSATVAAGATIFLALNYTGFVAKASDLLWGPNYLLLYALIYVLSGLKGGPVRTANFIFLSVLMALFALSDWGLLAFVTPFTGFWLVYRYPNAWARLAALYIVLPIAAALCGYFAVILHLTGLEFFIENIRINFLERLGQGDMNTEAGQAAFLLYREHGLLLWPRDVTPYPFSRMVFAFGYVFRQNFGWISWPMVAFALWCCLRLLRSIRFHVSEAILIAICLVLGEFLPLALLPIAPITVRRMKITAARTHEPMPGVFIWLAFCLLALLCAFAVFPGYVCGNLFAPISPNPPQGLFEMVLFGELLRCLTTIRPRERKTTHAGTPVSSAQVLILLLPVSFLAVHALQLYRALPPMAYAYADALSKPAYRNRSFATSNDEAVVWYYTHGWAFIVGNELPSPVTEHGFKLFRDWKESASSYAKPEYYLCDHGRFSPSRQFFDPAAPGQPALIDCVQVADYLNKRYGFLGEHVTPDFAIIRLRAQQPAGH